MYIPKAFRVTDRDEIFSFVEANAFGQPVSSVEGRIFSSHMPFLVSEDKQNIVGHFAKQNPQHIELDNQEALVNFLGPHDYISPSWYNSPGVPTWNYQAVHVNGVCRVFNDQEKLKALVDALTEKYESTMTKPWEPNYAPSLLTAIVGVEMSIAKIECKYKLSQNRPTEDQQSVIEQLGNRGSNNLVDAMRKIK
jgi:transcriptional regulator